MKQQDLKALSKLAVDRALAAREAAGVELTAEQVESVAGGALGSLSYIKDPTWYGIWEKLKPVGLAQPAIDLGPNAKIEAGIASGKLAF